MLFQCVTAFPRASFNPLTLMTLSAEDGPIVSLSRSLSSQHDGSSSIKPVQARPPVSAPPLLGSLQLLHHWPLHLCSCGHAFPRCRERTDSGRSEPTRACLAHRYRTVRAPTRPPTPAPHCAMSPHWSKHPQSPRPAPPPLHRTVLYPLTGLSFPLEHLVAQNSPSSPS